MPGWNLGLTVPIVTEETTNDIAKSNPRATHEEMVNFILSDLDKAEIGLESYIPTSKNFPDLAVVYGLKAKVYMWDGQFDKAAEYARTPESNGYLHAIELQDQINQFNKGIFVDGSEMTVTNTPFSYGVACYPEKHEEAPNIDTDIYWLKKKMENGAEYAVTQLFYDNRKYFDFAFFRTRSKALRTSDKDLRLSSFILITVHHQRFIQADITSRIT